MATFSGIASPDSRPQQTALRGWDEDQPTSMRSMMVLNLNQHCDILQVFAKNGIALTQLQDIIPLLKKVNAFRIGDITVEVAAEKFVSDFKVATSLTAIAILTIINKELKARYEVMPFTTPMEKIADTIAEGIVGQLKSAWEATSEVTGFRAWFSKAVRTAKQEVHFAVTVQGTTPKKCAEVLYLTCTGTMTRIASNVTMKLSINLKGISLNLSFVELVKELTPDILTNAITWYGPE